MEKVLKIVWQLVGIAVGIIVLVGLLGVFFDMHLF